MNREMAVASIIIIGLITASMLIALPSDEVSADDTIQYEEVSSFDGKITDTDNKYMKSFTAGNYKLLNDINLTSLGARLSVAGDVNIDLNGHSINLRQIDAFMIQSGATFTVIDSNPTTGDNPNGIHNTSNRAFNVQAGGTLRTVGVNISSDAYGGMSSAGTFIMEGGSLSSASVALDASGGSVTITGGTITGNNDSYPAVKIGSATVTIGTENGTSTNDPYISSIDPNNRAITVHSGHIGTIKGIVGTGSILDCLIDNFEQDYAPAGYAVSESIIDGVTYCTLIPITDANAEQYAEAKLNDTYYTNIVNAAADMENGDTITLLKNYDGSGLSFKVYTGTLDLAGHTITSTSTNAVSIKPMSNYDYVSGTFTITSSEGNGGISSSTPVNMVSGDSRNLLFVVIDDSVTLTSSNGGACVNMGTSSCMSYSEKNASYINAGGFLSYNDEDDGFIYGSFQIAADNSRDGEVTLMHNYSGSIGIIHSGTYVLDLNNNKVDSDSTYGINIAENGVHVKIMNGSINVDRNGRSANEIIAVQVGIPPEPAPGDTQRVYDDLSLTLEKVTVTTDGYWGIDTNGNNTDIVIELIDSSVESEGHGIYFPATGSVSLKNSSVSGDVTGIEMRRGSLSIEGTSTVSGGTDFDSFPSTGGTAVNGVAIAIAPYSSETPIEVSITSGTFAGYHGLYEEDVIDVGLGQTSISVRGGSFYGTSQPVKIADVDSDSNPLISNFITGGAFYTGTTVNATPVDSLPTGYIPTGYEVSTYKPGTVEVSDPDAMVVQTSDGVQYASLQEAIEAVPSGTEIDLIASVNENITIPSGKTIILDLNGNKLQSPEDSTEDLIVVESGGNLTIRATGGGTVDCTVNGRACLVNNGTVVIEGGDFIRSKQAFDTEYPATGGSWKHTHYVIENDGTMTIEGGSFIMGFEDDSTEGGYYLGNVSSVITNGQTNTSGSAKLTINGGDFIGAANIVKNNSGVLTITDGTFTMDNRAHRWVGGNNMVQNAPDSTMNITGGDFYAYGYGGAIDDDDWARHGIYNSGTANVSGITLTMEGQYSDGIVQSNTATGDMSLSDCTVTVDVNDPTSRAIVVGTNASDHQVVISSGTYTGTVVASSPELLIVGGTYSHSGDISAFIDPSLEYEDDGSGNIVVTTPQIFSVGSMYALSEHFRLPLAVESTEGIQFYFPTGVSYDKGTGVVTISATAESEFTITARLGVNGYEEKLTVSNISGMVTAQDSEIELIVYSSDEIDDIVRERLSQMSGFGESVQVLSLDVSRVDGETEGVPFVIGVPNMFEGYEFTVVHFTDDGYDIPSFQISDGSITISPTSFSPFALVWYEPVTEPEPTPDPGWNPGWDDDDDYVPPIYVPGDTASSDDETVKIVACAAAAVVAAIMAAFLILGHRRE